MGDPEKILKMRVDMVVAMIQYEKFVDDYERTWIALNSNENG
jgi:hypothetical protein